MSEMQFPHCDPRILHAPYVCEHCDRHPDWQELRWRWGIAFTASGRKTGELPCPTDIPSVALTGPRGVPYSKADEDAVKAEIAEGRGGLAERMAEWAKHDRYLGGTGQVELCPQCGVTKFTGSPCPGCHPERRLPRIIPLETSQLAVTLPEMDRQRAANPRRCAACRALIPGALVRECLVRESGGPSWWVCVDAEACRARSGDVVPL